MIITKWNVKLSLPIIDKSAISSIELVAKHLPEKYSQDSLLHNNCTLVKYLIDIEMADIELVI